MSIIVYLDNGQTMCFDNFDELTKFCVLIETEEDYHYFGSKIVRLAFAIR